MGKDDVKKQIATAIKTRRQDMHIQQSDLAAAIGVDKSTMSRIEKGDNNLSAALIFTIAEALQTTPGALFGEAQSLSEDEAAIIIAYRAADERGKALISAAAEFESARQKHLLTGRKEK